MNMTERLGIASRFVHSLWLRCRTHLPPQQCRAFTPLLDPQASGIGPIFVINLKRQPNRWVRMQRELTCILDAAGEPLSRRAIRFAACDANTDADEISDRDEVEPYYTLGDQLFVEPQPLALPDAFDLARLIRMSQAEISIARSHIKVWKAIAQSSSAYALVLEDDVWFERGFGRRVEQAWDEMEVANRNYPAFDILYISYSEARYGAPKELVSKNVFRPERGLWFLSGYVLSKSGAKTLLDLLPCRGPIDLWINHKFQKIVVRGLRRSVINQRLDTPSTNSYSILPELNRIGVLDACDASLFRQKPTFAPVFAFGPPRSGLSSLAMALSILGYRCCSDLEQIPKYEWERLILGRSDRIFDAYVNIGQLTSHINALTIGYPHGKFIVTNGSERALDSHDFTILDSLRGADLIHLYGNDAASWRALCEPLRLAPPAVPYPVVPDIGLRVHRQPAAAPCFCREKRLQHDRSPWVVDARPGWTGITAATTEPSGAPMSRVNFKDDLANVEPTRWLRRNDTFASNLGLFRPANVTANASGGLSLSVIREPLGVRDLSAAAITSCGSFLYGRFEAVLQATNTRGLVTGFFLHRNSPRQEIDIEITGNRPTQLLVNVFYNPGAEGTTFDYGFRGTPTVIPLEFDSSKEFHKYAIEWAPCEIQWFVDDKLVHRRAEWNPTPIPHLPMTLHVNTWPTRSRELAGRLALRALPASAIVRSIVVDALNGDQYADSLKR